MVRRLLLRALTVSLAVSAVAVPVWMNASFVRRDAAALSGPPAAMVDSSIPIPRVPSRADRSKTQAQPKPKLRPPPMPKHLEFAWPVTGVITSPFGPRGDEFHHGMDIGCLPTQTIGASEQGVVVFAGEARTYGNVVVVHHGRTYYTLYAHLSELWVEHGDPVRARQALGLCGSTGRSTGPHLHFEIRYDGYVWDPLDYLRRARS